MKLLAPPSPIKSVQRGLTTVSNGQQVVISEVDLSKSFISYSNNNASSNVAIRFYSSTRLEFLTTYNGSSVSWEIIEYA